MRSSFAMAFAALVLAGCVAAPQGSGGASPGVASGQASAGASTLPVASAGSSIQPTVEPAATAGVGPVLPTTQPTGPAWTPRPAEAVLLESIVSVRVDRLNKRAKPSVDSKSLGVLQKGDFLYISDYGPFSRDGYTWYLAQFLGSADEPPLNGNIRQLVSTQFWIAAAKGSSAYVKPFGPRCPDVIDASSVQYMLGSDLLECFGSHTIELTGTFGCGGCGGARAGIYEPGWLAYPLNYNFLVSYPIGEESGGFAIRFPPGGPDLPAPGSVIRVRGHFDDPAATTCAISVVDPMHPNGETLVAIPAAAARLRCAQEFVVETVEILGTDPGFILG